MKRILITGMSGTGKSSIISELAARGYKAVDLDCDEFSEWVAMRENITETHAMVELGRDWVWRTNRVQQLLAAEDADALYVSGCAANMNIFLNQFNQVVLLSASAELIAQRLATRTNNIYGKRPEELQRVLLLLQSIEPLLRNIASCEIDTSVDIASVVENALAL